MEFSKKTRRQAEPGAKPSPRPDAPQTGAPAGMPLFASGMLGAVQTKRATGASGDSAEAEADRFADAVLSGGAGSYSRASLAAAAPAAPDGSIAGSETGRPIPPAQRERLEQHAGIDLASVRIHTGRGADASARAIRARAFTHGRDVAFARAAYQPETTGGFRLLAHEVAHVVQQNAAGNASIQRQPDTGGVCEAAPPQSGILDPRTVTLTYELVSGWNETQLQQALELLLDQAAPGDVCVTPADPATIEDNLRIVLSWLATNHDHIPDDLLARLPQPTSGGNAEALASMNIRLHLMAAQIQRDFESVPAPVQARLDGFARLYPWLDTIGLQEAQSDLDASASAVETVTKLHRVARDPGGDPEMTSAILVLDTALNYLLGALLTPDLASSIAGVEEARDAWLNQIVDSFSGAIQAARDPLTAAIDPYGYNTFSLGLRDNLHEPMHDTISGLDIKRSIALHSLDVLLQNLPGIPYTLEAQLDYVAGHSEDLRELLIQAEIVSMGRQLCEQGQTLSDETWQEYQINWDNYIALSKLSAALYNLVGRNYTSANVEGLRTEVTHAFSQAGERIESIRSYQRRVTWFINIAATLIGIGAMRAVMGISAVARLGTAGARIVGSLAFTGTRLLLTNNQGRPLTATGFAEDALKDYFLMRLMGGVDARIGARLGDTGLLATAARMGGAYGTMVAWTLTWNAIEPGAPSPTGQHPTSTGDVFLQTGIDMGVIMLVDAMLRVPSIPSTELAVRDPTARSEAIRQWDALRGQLKRTGAQLQEWLRGPRDDVTHADTLLEEASRLFGAAKGIHARFAELGELTDAQRAQLDANVDAMRESIGNTRTELSLGVRGVTPETWSYKGTTENISAYLEQLKRQGRVADVTDEGNGIYSVRTPEGELHWFYPEGRAGAPSVDVPGEAVDAAAPDVPARTRGQALIHLRGAGWSDFGSFAGGLPPGRGGPFITWAARPDVGAAMANGGLPMPVVRALAAGSPEQLAPIASEPAHPLRVWYAAWVTRNPAGSPAAFLDSIRDVIAWRGSMQVAGVEEAAALLDRRAGSLPPIEVDLVPSGTAMSAPGTPIPVYSQDLSRTLQGETVPGASYSKVSRGGSQWVIERSGGDITRLIEIGADGTIVQRIGVQPALATLRNVLAAIREAPNEAAARAELARADAPLRALDVLLDLRQGVPPDQIALIEALANHPLRSAAVIRFGPPGGPLAVDPSHPLASLPAEIQAIVNALPQDVQGALATLGAWNAALVPRMLGNPILLDALRQDPANGTIFLRTVAETHGMPLYEPHLHGAGALRYARRMAQDLIDAPPQQRDAMLANRLAFGDAMAAALDEPGFPTAARWPPLRARLEALATQIGNKRASGISVAVRGDAEILGREIEGELHLGIERAGNPQVQRFFAMYRLITGEFRNVGLPQIMADQAASGVGGLEVRGGPLPEVPDPITGGTRRIVSTPGEILSNERRSVRQTVLQNALSLLGDPTVAGFDKGGQEVAGQRLGVMVDISLATQGANFWRLAEWLGGRPNTLSAVRTVLGYDPLGPDSLALFQRVLEEQGARRDATMSPDAPLPPDMPSVPLADFAAQVRALRTAIARVAAEAPQYPGVETEITGGLPSGLQGVTIHAGEQLASGRIGVAELLTNVEQAIDAGVDRIGHATILGIGMPEDLGLLRFERQTNGDYRRRIPGPDGAMIEQTLHADDIAALEARRRAILARVAQLGIVLEVPPTSNIVLAGLPPLRHPVGKMLADQPDLRVAAATDNPAIHVTDLRSETGLLAAAAGMTLPRRVVLYLEGFSSRLGGRPLENVPELTNQIAESIVSNTPEGQRAEVLTALYQRWPIGNPPDAASSATPATFEATLRRILRGVLY